jgi:poly(hydroxyalkanoate) depolymerase family esterase
MALNSAMAEALRLTRSGNLMEATALLQSAFNGDAPAARPPASTGPVIDLVPERVSTQPRNAEAAGAGRAQSAPSGKTPTQGSFDQREYRGSEGAMGYRLYRPANVAAGMPLVVMLHGCTQSPEDFAVGTGMNRLAEEFGFLVAYPRQNPSANPQKCWNWFKPGDQRRGMGEPALIAAVTQQVIAEHGVDPARVYVAGLSAGGAAAAIMAAEYPDLFAAVGIHSGLACGAASDLPSALMAMKRGSGAGKGNGRSFVPVITFHGDRDTTVHEVNSREIVAAASAAAGVPVKVQVEEGRSATGRHYVRELSVDPAGNVLIEQWTIRSAGHAWSGGDASGSYTDPSGPEASREMVRFFLTKERA